MIIEKVSIIILIIIMIEKVIIIVIIMIVKEKKVLEQNMKLIIKKIFKNIIEDQLE